MSGPGEKKTPRKPSIEERRIRRSLRLMGNANRLENTEAANTPPPNIDSNRIAEEDEPSIDSVLDAYLAAGGASSNRSVQASDPMPSLENYRANTQQETIQLRRSLRLLDRCRVPGGTVTDIATRFPIDRYRLAVDPNVQAASPSFLEQCTFQADNRLSSEQTDDDNILLCLGQTDDDSESEDNESKIKKDEAETEKGRPR